MVYVRLAQEWVDGTGAAFAAGDMVDVDVATLAELEERGVVTAPTEPTEPTEPLAESVADPVAASIDAPAVGGPGADETSQGTDDPDADPLRAWAGPG